MGNILFLNTLLYGYLKHLKQKHHEKQRTLMMIFKAEVSQWN